MKASFGGVSHVGLVVKLLDDTILYSNQVNEKELKNINLKKIKINDSIIGPYILHLDDKSIILSENSPEDIKSILKEYFDINIVDTKANLLGNLFYIKNNKLIYTKAYKKDINILSSEFGLEPIQIKYNLLLPTTFKEYNNNLLISQLLPDKIIERLVEIIKPKYYDLGSINFGSPYLKYGIEINIEYMIVGDQSTGHEIVKAEETLLR